MTQVALKFKDIVLEFDTVGGPVRALDGVTMEVSEGTIIGIIGESGSGKSTVGFVAGRLLPHGVQPCQGGLTVLGQNVWDMTADDMRAMRQNKIRYVFQDPIATLDPTKRIGWQIRDAATFPLADADVYQALSDVGLSDPERLANSWPHEMSGGMAQRVVIAMTLVAEPRIIIADEATSALDASVRTRILELLRDICRDKGITLLLLSHDLWAVRNFCDRIAVMYAGRVVEQGPAEQVFAAPAHPYTQALLGASVGHEAEGEILMTIPGVPPQLHGPAQGCAFAPRCAFAQDQCNDARPEIDDKSAGWSLLCHRWAEIAEGAA